MKTVVILPTYNEAENLIPMVSAVQQSLPEAHVLIVDDNEFFRQMARGPAIQRLDGAILPAV